MTKKPDYVMVRVKATTHQRLKDEIARLCLAMERGHVDDARDNIDNSNPDALGLTMDAIINRMLDDRIRHRVRARKARAALRQRPGIGGVVKEGGE